MKRTNAQLLFDNRNLIKQVEILKAQLAQSEALAICRDEYDVLKKLNDDSVTEFCEKVDALKVENTRLLKILAQEASENDELGAEYTLVNVLREDLRVARLEREIAQVENAKLRAERDELSKMNSDGCDLLAKAFAERDAAQAQVLKLREALDECRDVLFKIGCPNTKIESYEDELPTCSKEHLVEIILMDMNRARHVWGNWGGKHNSKIQEQALAETKAEREKPKEYRSI